MRPVNLVYDNLLKLNYANPLFYPECDFKSHSCFLEISSFDQQKKSNKTITFTPFLVFPFASHSFIAHKAMFLFIK